LVVIISTGSPGIEGMTAHLKEQLAELRRETDDTYEYGPTGIPPRPEFGGGAESDLVRQPK
jgi:hypothetical protein